MKRLIGTVFTLLAFVAVPATAQKTAQKKATQWSDITEVVVRAPAAGPAMWKLTRGQSTVWVLGTLIVVPENLKWDQKRLARALNGAHVLITPAVSRSDPAQAGQLQALSKLPANGRLYEVLSEPVYARFEATVQREHLSINDYIRFQPVIAAGNLSRDALSAHGLSAMALYEQMTTVVRKSKVRTRRAGSYDYSALIAYYVSLDAAQAEACVVNGLDGLDYDLRTTQSMAKAWATGDLPAVMRLYREPDFLTCVLSGETTADMYQTYAIDSMTAAIGAALDTPGKSVAIVPFDDLLRKDGVLDRLKAEGVEITAPSQ
ncbi:TraB/GumN family protein [Asticcacaulis sp. BYS171W]|uniref:TraB/GumN family protein n=1 Tax=Asticcacaulis aquaticus TaxID=2984212 RepID=A0ABT5HRE1_9CAUL|nr:TraB/GumN family protein [Asticcacaulis aquaticus]MDC7682636.1 TraB/GumN family protein [Asticcacaulis aquaticus]